MASHVGRIVPHYPLPIDIIDESVWTVQRRRVFQQKNRRPKSSRIRSINYTVEATIAFHKPGFVLVVSSGKAVFGSRLGGNTVMLVLPVLIRFAGPHPTDTLERNISHFVQHSCHVRSVIIFIFISHDPGAYHWNCSGSVCLEIQLLKDVGQRLCSLIRLLSWIKNANCSKITDHFHVIHLII